MVFKFFRRKSHQLRDELRRVRKFRKLPDRFATFEKAWERHLPAFLNAVSSVGAMGYELRRQRVDNAASRSEVDAKIEDLSRNTFAKIDALRAEVFTKLQVQNHWTNDFAVSDKRWVPVSTTVVNQEKFNRGKAEGTKVNLGCGQSRLDDYLNVDSRKVPGVDIVANLDDLPFNSQSVSEIYSNHVLDRFTHERLCGKLLPYWRDLLRPSGTFRAIVPDTQATIAALGDGELSFADFRDAMLGTQDSASNIRYNLFSPESLTQILRDAGFKNIELVATGRRNEKGFEFEICATNG